MSFLTAKGLTAALRKPYHLGHVSATVLYSLLEDVRIGEHRVLLKQNYDTACWVPPVGKKAAHSIYLGDRMLARVVERFVIQVVPALKPLLANPKFDQQVTMLWEYLNPRQQVQFHALMQKAVVAYGRHERAHALDTPRDFKALTKDLAAIKVPFQLFNLFEDARIEEVDRVRTGERFGWVEIEALAPMNSPLNLFFRCIQLENRPDKKALEGTEPLAALAGTKWEGKPLSVVAARVAELYQATIRSATAEGLYPIMVTFLAEFKPNADDTSDKGEDAANDDENAEGAPDESGNSSGEPSQGGPQEKPQNQEGDEATADGSGESSGVADDADDGDDAEEADPYGQPDDGDGASAEDRGADLTTAAQAADEGDKFFTTFDANAEVLDGDGSEADAAKAKAKAAKAQESKGDVSGQGTPDSIGPVASGGRAEESDFLAATPGAIDATFKARVQALTQVLLRMFKSHTLNAATDNPGHRISGRHLARGELRFVHKKVFGGKGQRKYSIVFDCSGSMNGYPAREGKVLLLALNELARRGYLEGFLILSGFPKGRPGWLKYAFPVADSVILRIVTKHSAEGLQAAIQDNLADIKKCDDLFVYTDSNICDAPINRASFARNRVFPVGLYAGSEENSREMQRHFPQNIIRDNIEAIVETMVTRNRR